MTDHITPQAEYEAAVEAAKRRHPSSYAGPSRREAPVAGQPRFATNLARHSDDRALTAA